MKVPAMNLPRRGGQSGVSMIELLVALLIFSFGMLGLAGLQLRTLSYGQSSLFRTQATALADDVMDRMRAKRTGAVDGQWDVTTTGTSTNADLNEWRQEVAALLPDGQASIQRDVTSTRFTVTISWVDSPDKADRTTFTTVTGL